MSTPPPPAVPSSFARAPDHAAASREPGRYRTRVALITAVRLYREGTARLLGDRVSCIAIDALLADDALVARLLEFAPEVLLVDVATIRAGARIDRLREALPKVRVVAFAMAEEEDDVLACAAVGVSAFVSRDASVEDLLRAVDGARLGELHCSPRIAALMFGRLAVLARDVPVGGLALTSRQREVLAMVERGCSNKEIAQALRIELSTVKNHVHHLLERLQVRHRWEAPMAVRKWRSSREGDTADAGR